MAEDFCHFNSRADCKLCTNARKTPRCQGICISAKKQCKRQATPGKKFCYQHYVRDTVKTKLKKGCHTPGCGCSSKSMLMCTCKSVYYCSTKCQKADWVSHKKVCDYVKVKKYADKINMQTPIKQLQKATIDDKTSQKAIRFYLTGYVGQIGFVYVNEVDNSTTFITDFKQYQQLGTRFIQEIAEGDPNRQVHIVYQRTPNEMLRQTFSVNMTDLVDTLVGQ
jgi:hypothetical protein